MIDVHSYFLCALGSYATHNAWEGPNTGQYNNRSVLGSMIWTTILILFLSAVVYFCGIRDVVFDVDDQSRESS